MSDSTAMGKTGFVGLGNMGGPMARNLLKAGVKLVVHDIDARKVQALSAAGAEVAATPQAVARETTRSICLVETTAQAEAVIAGATGFLHGARRGHIVICMSTIDPFALRRMGEALAGQGITLLDAPVSGGTTGAAAGTLSVIVGGPAEGFAACEDLFRAMGRNVFHVGALGNGLAMKLLNNMLLQVNTVAVAEALVLGTKAGLDPRQIEQVVSVSTGHSQAFARSAPRMIGRDFSASGTTDISFKDQELETGFAKALGVPILLANLTQQVYQMARAAGYGKEDGSSVVKVLERLAGVTVGGEPPRS
ncbi:NAD(P)-dependent oxidoreductase [Siccirubricoccus deserti]|uniref:NAD(P)-dependent oxidoreductase n=1 Tax=Siccirubricoccus deserti TaxID=2013562 RepID=A0A9X0QZA0_9PROT|nr:NAD(P)-dependent oxidoreductase [Siccirubricoccus deserti]MBC4016640.1 NAD(P)-dependent oxidoreductase [Siccirubricoccus deserti]